MPRQPITINPRLVEEIGSIIALLLFGGTIVFVSFIPRPALAFSPTPCTYKYKATGVTQTLELTHFVVPKGCVLVTDSYAGDLNGVSWDQGGVFAFRAGTYTGFLFNGEYDIVAVAQAKQTFCGRVQQITSRGSAFSHAKPLPEWHLSKHSLLRHGHC